MYILLSDVNRKFLIKEVFRKVIDYGDVTVRYIGHSAKAEQVYLSVR